MPKDLQKARQLFLHAVGKLPPEQWESYVAQACGGDADLEHQVRSLLKVHIEAGSFLKAPAPGLEAALIQPPLEPIGTQIGLYKLLEQIGEGGMGVVYLAEQEAPVRRQVALKIIKPGMDTKEVIARFESERRTLALMNHPNIAHVLDAGATATTDGGYPGRPYFVMELVHGVPITEYCDQQQLATEERLALFITVCHAVQHAHQKGIIHRDIKPSNVLVSTHDGQPVPKVIDFGVAKATDHRVTERSLFTQKGQMIGTPAYMSPEQADMSALDIDTRSDIYSLGVLLYELLTGSTPFDSNSLLDAGFQKMQRIIREEEPPTPSLRVSRLGEKLPALTRERSTDAKKLVKLLRGDLDQIVMKALDKERIRRYDTPNSFAADVERFLSHQPVEASPPSLVYRIRKFARRNRAAVIATTLVSAALLLALTVKILAVLDAYQHDAIVAQERAKVAEQQTHAANALTLEARRAALMQQLQQLRLSDHFENWSEACMRHVEEIKNMRVSDDLRDEAAAILLGIDARICKKIDFEPAELAYDSSGQRLLMVRYVLEDVQNPKESHELALVKIWDSSNDELRELPQRQHDAYGAITFRHDGTPLQLVWDKAIGNVISLWDLVDQKAAVQLECPFDLKEAPVAWSLTPGGIAAGILATDPEGGRRMLVWHTDSGKLLGNLPTTAGRIELSPDGEFVAASSDQGIVEIWSLAKVERITRLPSGHSQVLCIAWSKDVMHRANAEGTNWLLALGSAGGDLTIWDVNARIPRSFCRGSPHDVHRVAFSPDGMTLASVGRNHPMLWDVATGQLLLRLRAQNFMSSLAFSPDGKSLAIGYETQFGSSGELIVWKLDEVRGQQVLRGLLSPVVQLCFSSNNRYLAAISQNWQAAVWDLQDHRLLHVFETPKGLFAESAGFAIDDQGGRIAVVAGTGAKVWDVVTGSVLQTLELPDGFLDRLVFRGDSDLLLVRQESVDPQYPPVGKNENPSKSPRVCRIRNLLVPDPLKPLLEIHDFRSTAIQILVTPDGQRVLVEGYDASGPNSVRTIKLYELPSGTERWTLRMPNERDNYLISLFDTTGSLLFMNNNTILNVDTGRLLRSSASPLRALGPGAKLNIGETNDPTLPGRQKRTLVRGDNDTILFTLGIENNSSEQPHFSSDGNLVAWGNVDGTVTVCDIPRVQRKLAEVGLGW